MKAKGAPKGERPYLTVHLDSSHTTDSVTFLTIISNYYIPLRQCLYQKYGMMRKIKDINSLLNTPKVTNTLNLTFVMI